ncbi:MAG: hypothetical protein ABSB70_15210 [Candidatus Velthaea sp.]
MPVRVFDSVRARAVTVLTILALVVPLVPVRADDTAPAPKPFDVIDRAIARWQARPRPTLLSYTVDFTGSHGAKTYRRVFRVDYTVPTHNARITMLGSEGQAPAFVEPEKQRLSPTETFGFVSRDHALLGVTQSPGAAPLPVIAAVHAVVHYPYDVNLVGIEQVDRQRAYHLAFVPRQKPDDYPLRDLWVDATTYDVLKVIALQFEHIGPIRVPYLVRASYAQQGPYWLIRRAAAGATIRAGLFSYGSDAEASFEDFQYAP